MKRNRLYFGLLLFAVSAFLVGQTSPQCNCPTPPECIQPQGEGSGLDADTLDGKHAWECCGGGGGVSLHAVDAEGNSVGLVMAGQRIFDPTLGVAYWVDFWTGLPAATDAGRPKMFESADCSGAWLMYPFAPGDTFSAFDDPSTIYTVTAVGNRTIRSELYVNFQCYSYEPREERVGTEFMTVTLPQSFPAPLHYEAR